MGIKMSQKIPQWYMMAMWSMRNQKFIDQLSCKFSKIVKKIMCDWGIKNMCDSHFGIFLV